MVLVLFNCQWTRAKLLPVLFLIIRRSVTVKVICILLIFVTFDYMYKIKFSLSEQTHVDIKNEHLGVDCRFLRTNPHKETRCSDNDINLEQKPETSFPTVRGTQLQTSVNGTIAAAQERSDSLTGLNLDIVLEDIQMGITPFPPTNPHPYQLISLPDDCDFQGDSSKILILMHSHPGNTYQRKNIRRKRRQFRDPNTRLVFLLGFLEDAQYMVEDESDQYRDILQEDFRDSYRNDTIKLIMGYNWAVNHCPDADVILSLNEALQVKSDMLYEYIRDLIRVSPTSLFRGHFEQAKHHNTSKSETFNFNLASFNIAKKFQAIFPYIKIGSDDTSGYIEIIANTLSIKRSYDPYFDPKNSVSFLAPTGQNVSRDLLTYPLNVNLRGYVRQQEVMSQTPINKHVIPLLHNATRCHFQTKGTDAVNNLVIIWSDGSDSEQRSAIREAWGYTNNTAVSLVFVIGSLDTRQSNIDNESKNYRDIIQIAQEKDKFYDTVKTVATFTWIVQNCKKANFILFLDGNISINVSMATRLTENLIKSNIGDVYLGHVMKGCKPDRRPDSSTFISERDFPFDEVPPRVIGLNYIMSFNITRSFHIAFPFVKYCHVVDIYMGIVASKLKVLPKHDGHFDRGSHLSFFREYP